MWAHDLKLARARKHFKELEAEIDRWVNVDGCAISVEPNPEPPHYLVRAEFLREPDSNGRLSLLISDVLQNARAALEYVAYALGEAGADGGMTEQQAENSSFPIIGDRDKDGFLGRGPDVFRAQAGTKLATVAPEARAVIEQLQPFYLAPAWELDGLWWLNELARIDRHRRLHLTVVRHGDLRPDPARLRNVKLKGEINAFRGVVYEPEDGADLARFEAIPANPQEKMHVHFRDPVTVAFDTDELTLPIISDWGVTSVLNATISSVAGALGKLRPYLLR